MPNYMILRIVGEHMREDRTAATATCARVRIAIPKFLKSPFRVAECS